jgi:tRNA(Ile)-lysidine synthase
VSTKTPALLELRKAVRTWFEKLEPNSKVCIGVSGGADSLALAAASKLESANFPIDLIAVIVDHGLQDNSEETAQFAKQQLIQLGFQDIFIGRANVQITDGLEASARRARYKVFQQAIDYSLSTWWSLALPFQGLGLEFVPNSQEKKQKKEPKEAKERRAHGNKFFPGQGHRKEERCL